MNNNMSFRTFVRLVLVGMLVVGFIFGVKILWSFMVAGTAVSDAVPSFTPVVAQGEELPDMVASSTPSPNPKLPTVTFSTQAPVPVGVVTEIAQLFTPIPVLTMKMPGDVSIIEPTIKPRMLDNTDWEAFTNFNEVNDIAIDHEGYVWSSSCGGLVRWNPADGSYVQYNVKNGLKENSILQLEVASDGAVWGMGYDYLARFYDGQWTNYETPFKDRMTDNMAITSSGDVWISAWAGKGEGLGMYRFDGQDWTHFDMGSIGWVAVTPKGDVLASKEFGVLQYTGLLGWMSLEWVPWSPWKNLPFYDIAVAPDDTIWTRIGEQQVARLDGMNWRKYPIPADDGIGYQSLSMAAAPNGILWIIRAGENLLRFDGNAWTEYRLDDRMSHDSYRSPIAVDPRGGVWVGEEHGLWYFDGVSWEMYRIEGLLSGNVLDIAAGAEKGVWFSTDYSVSRFDGQSWQAYTPADGLTSDYISLISAASNGPVWAYSDDDELFGFSGTNWINYHQDVLTDECLYPDFLAASPNGTLWLGQRGYGVVCRLNEEMNVDVYAPGFEGVNAIATDPKGTVWFGTDGGMYHFDGESWESYLDDVFGQSVTAVAVASDGTLWCAGYGNSVYLARFDGANWMFYQLPGNFISSVAALSGEEIWVAMNVDDETQNGITTTKGQLIHFSYDTWTSYDLEDLWIHSVDQMVAMSDGSIWILSSYGEVVQIKGH